MMQISFSPAYLTQQKGIYLLLCSSLMDVVYRYKMNPVGTDASVQCERVTEVYKVILGHSFWWRYVPKEELNLNAV